MAQHHSLQNRDVLRREILDDNLPEFEISPMMMTTVIGQFTNIVIHRNKYECAMDQKLQRIQRANVVTCARQASGQPADVEQ